MNGFIKFIREQGVVGLAIGFILGGSINQVVNSLVKDIIQPTLGFIFGSQDGLASWRYESLMYGNFIANIINFVLIAALVYFIFKRLKLDSLDLPKQQK